MLIVSVYVPEVYHTAFFMSTMLPEELIFVYMTREEKTRSWMKE